MPKTESFIKLKIKQRLKSVSNAKLQIQMLFTVHFAQEIVSFMCVCYILVLSLFYSFYIKYLYTYLIIYLKGFIPNPYPLINHGPTDSIYMRLKARNRCNHRDYQNIAVNGKKSIYSEQRLSRYYGFIVLCINEKYAKNSTQKSFLGMEISPETISKRTLASISSN